MMEIERNGSRRAGQATSARRSVPILLWAAAATAVLLGSSDASARLGQGTCVDDVTWQAPKGDGRIVNCIPYRCVDGTCPTACASDDVCAPGHACDFHTFATAMCRPIADLGKTAGPDDGGGAAQRDAAVGGKNIQASQSEPQGGCDAEAQPIDGDGGPVAALVGVGLFAGLVLRRRRRSDLPSC